MKKLQLLSLIWFLLISCENNASDTSKITSDTGNTLKKVKAIDSVNIMSDSLANKKENKANKDEILGTWAFIGTKNAAFVIDKKTITYPEIFKAYKYLVVRDTIRIKYDDYDGAYYFKLQNKDTLIMIGDEKQVYYRIKR